MYFQHTICLLLFITITGSFSSDWETFKQDYYKEYSSPEEEIERREIFLENVRQMKEYQRNHPDAKFTMGINHLTDRRTDDFLSNVKPFQNSRSEKPDEPTQSKKIIDTQLDWRGKNVITPVYNQSSPELSTAIATVEVIESYRAITSGTLTQGSVDQVNRCCGNILDPLSCILNQAGGEICSEETYSPTDDKCKPTKCQSFGTFNEVKTISPPMETTMLEWIQDAPLYVVINAQSLSFQMYQWGIYSDSDCLKTNNTHAVQLVGYGIEYGIPYWLLKNNWGKSWGEEGYMRIERGRNMCGIANHVIRIGTTPAVNNAGQSGQFETVYFIILCLFVQIFLH